MTLFINAMNVHQGGGRTLFMALVEALPVQPVIALLDARLAGAVPVRPGLEVRSVSPTMSGRFAAERWLSRAVKPSDTLLCFGNLPPLFRSEGNVIVFLQNRYLLDLGLAGFRWTTRLRLIAERWWLRLKAHNASRFIVQTASMRTIAVQSGRLAGRRVDVRPFVGALPQTQPRLAARRAQSDMSHFRFVYVATGEPHKNHRNLLDAWRLLAAKGFRPVLDLTVGPTSPDIVTAIDTAVQRDGLPIRNHGVVSAHHVRALYADADALVFPSRGESLGLPLLEAQAAGLPIIASELDYVRDVVSPIQTFDPASPVSIARAIMRFLGCDEQPMLPLSAGEFLAQVLERPRD